MRVFEDEIIKRVKLIQGVVKSIEAKADKKLSQQTDS